MRKKIKGTNKFIDEDGYIYSENGKRYSRWVDNVGYYQSCFQENKAKRYIRIHRLLAEYFIPNPNNYKQVNHIDGNKLNNSLNNLEWVTNSENTKHAYNNNLYKSKYRCPIIAKNKSDGSIQEFKSIRECASVLGLNRKTITSILKKKKETTMNLTSNIMCNDYPLYVENGVRVDFITTRRGIATRTVEDIV